MKKPGAMARLIPLADLAKDRDLAAFAAINRERAALLAQFAQLGEEAPSANDADLPAALLSQAEEIHSLWRTARRMQLNTQLARCSAEWAAKHELAERSFGRSAVLARLAKGKR